MAKGELDDYARVMLSLAARGCVRAGMRRQLATLEFMAAFDDAADVAFVQKELTAVVRELEPGDFTGGEKKQGT